MLTAMHFSQRLNRSGEDKTVSKKFIEQHGLWTEPQRPQQSRFWIVRRRRVFKSFACRGPTNTVYCVARASRSRRSSRRSRAVPRSPSLLSSSILPIRSCSIHFHLSKAPGLGIPNWPACATSSWFRIRSLSTCCLGQIGRAGCLPICTCPAAGVRFH